MAKVAVFPIWTIPEYSGAEGDRGAHPQSSVEEPNTHSIVEAGVRIDAILEVQKPSCVASHISLTVDDEFRIRYRTMTFDKSQMVRVLDVFLLGPFMIWYALQSRGIMPKVAVAAMFLSGILTIVYNGVNYLGNYGWIPRSSLFGTK